LLIRFSERIEYWGGVQENVWGSQLSQLIGNEAVQSVLKEKRSVSPYEGVDKKNWYGRKKGNWLITSFLKEIDGKRGISTRNWWGSKGTNALIIGWAVFP